MPTQLTRIFLINFIGSGDDKLRLYLIEKSSKTSREVLSMAVVYKAALQYNKTLKENTLMAAANIEDNSKRSSRVQFKNKSNDFGRRKDRKRSSSEKRGHFRSDRTERNGDSQRNSFDRNSRNECDSRRNSYDRNNGDRYEERRDTSLERYMTNYTNYDYEAKGSGNWQRNNRNLYNNRNSYGINKTEELVLMRITPQVIDDSMIYQEEIVEDKDHLGKVQLVY